MEVPGGYQNKLLVCVYEALGTCMLFVTVNMTAGNYYQVFAVGFILMIDIILLGPVSNSHVNPAVTLGVFVRECGQARAEGKWLHNLFFALRIMFA